MVKSKAKQVATSRLSPRAKKRKHDNKKVTKDTAQPTPTPTKKRRVKNASAGRKTLKAKVTKKLCSRVKGAYASVVGLKTPKAKVTKKLCIQEETKVDKDSSYQTESDDDSSSDGSDDDGIGLRGGKAEKRIC